MDSRSDERFDLVLAHWAHAEEVTELERRVY